MPVEIKELVIRAMIQEGGEGANSGEPAQVEVELIVQACVERVMEIIKDKNDR